INNQNIIKIVNVYNKTISVRGLFIIQILSKYIITKINPKIVKYYYKISNQPITKIMIKKYSSISINKFISCGNTSTITITLLLLVGISETLRANTNDISILCLSCQFYSTCVGSSNSYKNFQISDNKIKFEKILDNHNNEINLDFKQWFAGLTDGDGYIY